MCSSAPLTDAAFEFQECLSTSCLQGEIEKRLFDRALWQCGSLVLIYQTRKFSFTHPVSQTFGGLAENVVIAIKHFPEWAFTNCDRQSFLYTTCNSCIIQTQQPAPNISLQAQQNVREWRLPPGTTDHGVHVHVPCPGTQARPCSH